MSINFDNVITWATPRGNVSEVTDPTGKVLWSDTWLGGTFKVEKITAATYASETLYENEKFILLDIYPKSGGTVNITYEGFTKTIIDDGTASTPNAQQVFFGTFNGITDEVATPDSGVVTITGDCRGAGCGDYSITKLMANLASCINTVGDLRGFEFIPSSAFQSCALSNRRIKLPANIVNIEARAFQGCSNLKFIIIPTSVITIGVQAFSGCPELAYIEVDKNNKFFKAIDGNLYTEDGKTLRQYAIGKTNTSFIIPESVINISEYALAGCKALTSVSIPDSVASIGNFAFEGCTSLESVNIPNSVTSIKSFTFSNCSSLTKIMIPDSVTSIEVSAFQNCKSLAEVAIPNSVTSIGLGAFAGCSSLIYNEYDNAYYLGNDNNPYLILMCAKSNDITSCVVHENTKFIYQNAFYDCKQLSELFVPEEPPKHVGSVFNYNDENGKDLTESILCYLSTSASLDKYTQHEDWQDFAGKYRFPEPVHITFNAGTYGQGSMTEQEIWGYQALNKNTFTSGVVGYRFIGWNTKADGSGTSYSDGASVAFTKDTTLYAQWSNICTITYKHTNRSNFYGQGETGHQECYELRINGEPVGDLGAFTNGARTLNYVYGPAIEVAGTWWDGGSLYSSVTVNIYLNDTSISNNSSTRPSGYYPYSSGESLTYADASRVAYLKFIPKGDTTINFVAKTNAPTIFNKKAYWDCYITGDVDIVR